MHALKKILEDVKGQERVVSQVLGLLSLKLETWEKRVNLHFAGDNGACAPPLFIWSACDSVCDYYFATLLTQSNVKGRP